LRVEYEGAVYHAVNNPDYVRDFIDTGFRQEYQQEKGQNMSDEEWEIRRSARNQVTHFVGFLYAGYISPSMLFAQIYCMWWEGFELNADLKLGLKAIGVANQLKEYYPTWHWTTSPVGPGGRMGSALKIQDSG
jgi:hypothetical protein